MPPHLFGQHAPPRAQQPLRNAQALGLWHEPPRIRRPLWRRAPWRRRPLAALATAALALGLLTLAGWTFTLLPPTPGTIIVSAGAGQ